MVFNTTFYNISVAESGIKHHNPNPNPSNLFNKQG